MPLPSAWLTHAAHRSAEVHLIKPTAKLSGRLLVRLAEGRARPINYC
jgi:hypothetical protein